MVTTLTEEVTLNCMQSHFTQKVLLELFNNQQETPKHVFVKSTLENLKATSCPFIQIKEKVPDAHTLRVIVIYVRVKAKSDFDVSCCSVKSEQACNL